MFLLLLHSQFSKGESVVILGFLGIAAVGHAVKKLFRQ